MLMYDCHYCSGQTKDVSYKCPPGSIIMKCSSCNVTYRFRNDGLIIVSICIDYKGDKYYYRLIDHKMVLMKLNKNPVEKSNFFTRVCEVDPDKITPDNALKKLPLFLTFS